MKTFLMAIALIAVASAAPALAEVPPVKATIKDRVPALATPQQEKIKRLSKKVFVPQTEQGNSGSGQTGETTEPQETTPQAAPQVQFQPIIFERDTAATPACRHKWFVTITNTGTVDIGNLELRETYRKAPGVNETVRPALGIEPLPAGVSQPYVGFVIERTKEESELVVQLLQNGTVLGSIATWLPPAVAPSADTVVLGDGQIAGTTLSFALQNTSSTEVNSIEYRISGYDNAEDTIPDFIGVDSIWCLPASGTETITFPLPSTAHTIYEVNIRPRDAFTPFATRRYTR